MVARAAPWQCQLPLKRGFVLVKQDRSSEPMENVFKQPRKLVQTTASLWSCLRSWGQTPVTHSKLHAANPERLVLVDGAATCDPDVGCKHPGTITRG